MEEIIMFSLLLKMKNKKEAKSCLLFLRKNGFKGYYQEIKHGILNNYPFLIDGLAEKIGKENFKSFYLDRYDFEKIFNQIEAEEADNDNN